MFDTPMIQINKLNTHKTQTDITPTRQSPSGKLKVPKLIKLNCYTLQHLLRSGHATTSRDSNEFQASFLDLNLITRAEG